MIASRWSVTTRSTSLGGGGLDRHFVHAVRLDGVAHRGAKRLIEIAGPEARRAAVPPMSAPKSRTSFTLSITCSGDHRVEIDRHAVRRHQVGELRIDAARLHVDVDALGREGHVLQAGLHRRRIDAAAAEDERLPHENGLVARVGLHRRTGRQHHHRQRSPAATTAFATFFIRVSWLLLVLLHHVHRRRDHRRRRRTGSTAG